MALPSRPVTEPRYRAGDVIAGKYRLDGLLGEGGMGAVWGAFNLQLEAAVALKLLIRDDGDRELLTQRLRQEAKATAKLGHPAIVRVFDVGESELGDAFIVMELLKGRSLSTVLAEDGCLPAARAVQLLLPIADALSAAHGKGLIHRDLKPDNVFIVAEDDQVQPKLVDFGIVKIDDQTTEKTHLTQLGAVLGSPEYMSPEQARGLEDVDHRTDIWSFCVVLYEAISGATPFAAPNYNALLRAIVEDEPEPFLARSAEESELWRIVQRGMAKAREQRFRSMSEVGRALASWLIRQGITEDACGASLEAKWILRSSDPTSLRAGRASLPSLTSVPPESGVRANALATAPTIDAQPASDPPLPSESGAEPSRHAERKASPVTLIAVSAAVVITLLIALAVRRGAQAEAESSVRAKSAPALIAAEARPQPAQTGTGALASAPVSVSEVSPPSAAPLTEAPLVPQASPDRPKAKVRRAPAARPAAPAASTNARAPNDLLSPY